MKLSDLTTPCLTLDRRRLKANIAAMHQRIDELGVALRPHAKTAKSAEVLRLVTAGQAGGITVSTLAEAEYFFERGFPDMIYAAPVTPAKLDRVAALNRQGADLKIITDDAGVAAAIAAHGGPNRVLIEIDCGEHRTGVAADGPEVMAIAEALTAAAGTAELVGVLTHAGHSYLCRDAVAAAEVAEAERAAAVAAAERLRGAGHACPMVSVGSTPTALHARHLDGVSEARPGVFAFGDLFQAGIGSCQRGDIAVGVLASVIAHNRASEALMIDAGGLALSKDRSTAALGGDGDCRFGVVVDPLSGAGFAELPELQVVNVHQEHGEVKRLDGGPLPFERFPVGALVRVMPNHVCMMAAAHDRYFVGEGGDNVVAVWERCRGW